MESAAIMQPASVPCILGVDPGLSGAIAFLFPGHLASDRVTVEDVPVADGEIDGANLAARLVQMRPTMAVIERVGAMPGQGVSSTFKFGQALGTVLGVVAALGIPIERVHSTRWKRHFRLSADKEEARALALRRFPDACKSLARKKDHGRAEAALIALWAAETRAG